MGICKNSDSAHELRGLTPDSRMRQSTEQDFKGERRSEALKGT